MKSFKDNLNKSINQLLEKINPETKEDSDKLLKLAHRLYYKDQSGKTITDDEKALLNKYNLEYKTLGNNAPFIYPKELNADNIPDIPRYSNRVTAYSVSPFYLNSGTKWDDKEQNWAPKDSKDLKIDWTQAGRKRFQRDSQGTSKYKVANNNEYSRQSYDELERDKQESDMYKKIKDFKDNKNFMKHYKKEEKDMNIDKSLTEDMDNVESEVYNWLSGWYDDQINNASYQTQDICADIPDYDPDWASYDGRDAEINRLDNQAKEIWLEAQMKALFAHKSLSESLSQDAQEVVNPTYAQALKDLEETDKKKEDYLKVPEHNQGPKEVKVKGTPEMKKLHLSESLFEDWDELVNDYIITVHSDAEIEIEPKNFNDAGAVFEEVNQMSDEEMLHNDLMGVAWIIKDDEGKMQLNDSRAIDNKSDKFKKIVQKAMSDNSNFVDHYNESISNEINDWNLQRRSYNPREYEEAIYGLIDTGILDWETVGKATLSWMSEDDIKELAYNYGWIHEAEEDDDLNEDISTKLSSDGRQRPTSYTKKTFRKPLSLQVYDALTDLGYDVFAGTEGVAFRTSKKNEKNLQPAKDYLDSKKVQYKVQPFQGRYHLLITLPEDDDEVFDYFDNIDDEEKRAVNESLTILSDLSAYEPWGPAVDTWNKIEDEGKIDMLEAILEDMYPNGINKTDLNDILAYQHEDVCSWLNINEDEDDEEFDESLNNKSNKKSK